MPDVIVPPAPGLTKQQFVTAMLEYIDPPGTPVVMGAKGTFFVDGAGVLHQLGRVMVDCSGSITFKLFQKTGRDFRNRFNAQGLHDLCPELVQIPEPGDFGFMGFDDRRVGHVVMAVAGGGMLSADGARSDRQTVDELMRVLMDPSARVRLYAKVPQLWGTEHFLGWRNSQPFLNLAK